MRLKHRNNGRKWWELETWMKWLSFCNVRKVPDSLTFCQKFSFCFGSTLRLLSRKKVPGHFSLCPFISFPIFHDYSWALHIPCLSWNKMVQTLKERLMLWVGNLKPCPGPVCGLCPATLRVRTSTKTAWNLPLQNLSVSQTVRWVVWKQHPPKTVHDNAQG